VQIRNLNEKIEKIRGISGRCPVCDRRLTEEHRKKLVQERKERIKGLQPQLEKKEKEIAKFDAWLLKDKEEQRRREEFIRNLQEILRKRMELDEKVKLEAEKELKLKKIIANVRKLEKRFAAEIIKSMHHKLQKLVAEKSAMQEKANACKELVLDLRERLKSLQEKKNMLIKQEQEIKRAELVCKEMQKFHNALTETQLSLRQQFITSVNATMADVWAELYPYGDYSSVRLGVEAGDYTLQLLGGGGWVSVERVASGGERTVACLALRIAFSLALAQNLRWLVLDEPTHNLDERAVKDLANVLRSKITEFVDQVFLITHDPRLEDGVTGYLYRLERAKEKSEPTQVRCVTSPSD
jgi:exonuclease SbcC